MEGDLNIDLSAPFKKPLPGTTGDPCGQSFVIPKAFMRPLEGQPTAYGNQNEDMNPEPSSGFFQFATSLEPIEIPREYSKQIGRSECARNDSIPMQLYDKCSGFWGRLGYRGRSGDAVRLKCIRWFRSIIRDGLGSLGFNFVSGW